MSKTTIALEAAVAAVISIRSDNAAISDRRRRQEEDRAFARVMKIVAPRIRHFINQYGLAAHWEDAEQVCAIAVHRAIVAYDPTKAQFTTFINWQIRGELQSLRFRLMTDQRPSAQKVQASTVSLHATTSGPEGEEATLESLIQDDAAEVQVEAGVSDYLAQRTFYALVDQYMEQLRLIGEEQLRRRPRPKRRVADADGKLPSRNAELDAELHQLYERLRRDRKVIVQRMLDPDPDAAAEAAGISKERARQISKRAFRKMSEAIVFSSK